MLVVRVAYFHVLHLTPSLSLIIHSSPVRQCTLISSSIIFIRSFASLRSSLHVFTTRVFPSHSVPSHTNPVLCFARARFHPLSLFELLAAWTCAVLCPRPSFTQRRSSFVSRDQRSPWPQTSMLRYSCVPDTHFLLLFYPFASFLSTRHALLSMIRTTRIASCSSSNLENVVSYAALPDPKSWELN